MATDSYRESSASPRLAELLECTWRRHVEHAGYVAVLPDGCLDIVWSSERGLFIAGPDRGPVDHPAAPETDMVGVRLRPGVAATVLGVPTSELCDRRVDLDDVWGPVADDLSEQIAAATPDMQVQLLEDAIVKRLSDDGAVDRPVLHAVELVAGGTVSMAELGDRVGLSDRQLLRRFRAQVGYPPKVLDRVLRFRRFLRAGRHIATGSISLAGAAAAVGYADQAHLTRECGRLAGRTPAELVNGENVQDRATMAPSRWIHDPRP